LASDNQAMLVINYTRVPTYQPSQAFKPLAYFPSFEYFITKKHCTIENPSHGYTQSRPLKIFSQRVIDEEDQNDLERVQAM